MRALRPEAIPGLPMPRCFSKGFSARDPGIRLFRVMRTFSGVDFAIPYFRTLVSYFENNRAFCAA
jgi:hypothetical protein